MGNKHKNRRLRITDLVKVESVDIVEDKKKVLDSFGISSSNDSIVVKIAATHSGRVTKNNTFYLADKMKDSVHTWTKDYNKPILVHHDKEGTDPIGRVISARYVDTSDNLQGSIRNTICRIYRDSNTGELELKKFIDGEMPFMQQIDFVQDRLSHTKILDDTDYDGLGYIELTALISDPEAIQKVKDGRYLTGSISATTDRAVCSVCKQDWIDEGKCDHSPGDIYDGSKAFLVAGEFEYEEYSYVNDPADTLSQNIELIQNGLSDKVEDSNKESDKLDDAINVESVLDVQMVMQQHDALHFRYDLDVLSAMRKKEDGGADELLVTPSSAPPPQAVYDLHEKLHREAVEGGFNDSLVLGALDRSLPLELVPPVPFPDRDEDTMEDSSKENKMADKDTKTLKDSEEVVSTDNENKEDESVDKEPVEGDKNTKDLTKFSNYTNEELEDHLKVLDSVTDEESEEPQLTEDNADAIYELMIRELDKIADNSSEEQSEKIEDAKLSAEQRKNLPDSAFCGPERSFPVPDCSHVIAARRLISRYDGPGSKKKIMACVDRKAKALGCDKETEDAVSENSETNLEDVVKCTSCEEKDQTIDQLNKELEKFQDHLRALREENSLLYRDFAGVEDQLVQANLTIRKLKVDRVTDYCRLSAEEPVDSDSVREEMSKLTDKELENKLSSVDMTKIVDKIESGLSRNPSGTVESPGGSIQDKTVEDPDGSKEGLNEIPEVIRKNYEYLIDKSGAKKAKTYLIRMVNQGELDPTWLDRLS